MPSIKKEGNRWVVNCSEEFKTYEEAQKRANELTFIQLQKINKRKEK